MMVLVSIVQIWLFQPALVLPELAAPEQAGMGQIPAGLVEVVPAGVVLVRGLVLGQVHSLEEAVDFPYLFLKNNLFSIPYFALFFKRKPRRFARGFLRISDFFLSKRESFWPGIFTFSCGFLKLFDGCHADVGKNESHDDDKNGNNANDPDNAFLFFGVHG